MLYICTLSYFVFSKKNIMNTTKLISTIVDHFHKYPSVYNNSYERLCNQFNTDIDTIKAAKESFMKSKNFKAESQEIKDDFEKQTKSVNLVVNENIKTPEQLMTYINLDADVWECTQFWSIIKNGKYHISALFKLKNQNEINYLKEFKDYVYVPNIYNSSFERIKINSYGTLIVYLADRHIGAMTKSNSLIDNEYNATVYENRMRLVLDEIEDLVKKHNIFNITVVDLGDLVDGQDAKTTRGGHTLPQNMTNREVFKTFMDVENMFFEQLCSKYGSQRITKVSVGDSNHGGDMEWFCHKAFEMQFKERFDEIQFQTGDKFVEHFFVNDHCFIVCHGKDSEDMKKPLPKNIDATTESWINAYIQTNKIIANHIHFVKGDLHQLSSDYGRFFRYKNCPSMYGSSKWASTNFMANQRGVAFDIVIEDQVIEHPLWF